MSSTFEIDDLLKATYLDDSSPTWKYQSIYMTVLSIEGYKLMVSLDQGSPEPVAGIVTVRTGNRTNPTRQNSIYIDGARPAMFYYVNVSSHNITVDNIAQATGNLLGYNFGDLTGNEPIKERFSNVIRGSNYQEGHFVQRSGNGLGYPLLAERGAWIDITPDSSGNRTCYHYDRVSHSGSMWDCAVKQTFSEPSKSNTDWTERVQKGDAGTNGSQGATGEQGQKGDKGDTGTRGLQGLQGLQGTQGVAGAKGTDGSTSYFHIKYAPVAKPTAAQITETPSTFIGTYVDFTEADSNDPAKYSWARFEGLQGDRGDQGIPGVGTDGKTTYLHIKYSNDGGASFTANNGETSGSWIGQYTDFEINDSNNVTRYTWSKILGADGKKTPYSDFTYAYGLTQPTVWHNTPPAKVEKQHLWERIQKYEPKADNSDWTLKSTSYAVINEYLQIGGVNLLDNSEFKQKTASPWATRGNHAATIDVGTRYGDSNTLKITSTGVGDASANLVLASGFSLPVGTFSCYVKAENPVTLCVRNTSSYTSYKTFSITTEWQKLKIEGIANYIGNVLWLTSPGTVWIARPQTESGVLATSWSPSIADTKTSIAEASKVVMFQGNFSIGKAYFNNHSRQDCVEYNSAYYRYIGGNGEIQNSWDSRIWAPFGSSWSSIATNLLLAEEANVANFIFKNQRLESTARNPITRVPRLILDGSIGKLFGDNIEVTGKVNATSGAIGAFKIDRNTIYSEVDGAAMIFDDPTTKTFAGLGSRLLPASSAPRVAIAGRFEVERATSATYSDNIGMRVGATGSTNSTSNNVSLDIIGGYISGAAFKVNQIATSMTLKWEDSYMTCYNSAQITLTLPSTSDYKMKGKVFYIKRVNSQGPVKVSGNIHTTSIQTSINLNHGDMWMFVCDGQYWHGSYQVRP